MQVELDNLGHWFTEGNWLFRGITTALYPGHTYALTGPSGSGKSSLLGMLAGWIAPAEGDVRCDRQERVGWVFQNPHGSPRRTVTDHLLVPLLARGDSLQQARNTAKELLHMFKLTSVASNDFRQLSGGESQRLMLACGIAAQPTLLLIDEPTAQLDGTTGAEVNDVIRELVSESTIVVIATHDDRTRDACTDHIDLREFQIGSRGTTSVTGP